MRSAELDYELPPELIAQHPADRRDASRLLVFDRGTGAVRHRLFSELPDELAGELVVVNDTRVVPARLRLRRESGGEVEVLLLERRDGPDSGRRSRDPRGACAPGERLEPRTISDRRWSGRARRGAGGGTLAGAARGRAGGGDAAAAVHHRASRRSVAVPDRLRRRGRVGRSADRRPALHAGAARRARRRARDAARRARHVPAAADGDARGARAPRRALPRRARSVGAHPGRRPRPRGGHDDDARAGDRRPQRRDGGPHDSSSSRPASSSAASTPF